MIFFKSLMLILTTEDSFSFAVFVKKKTKLSFGELCLVTMATIENYTSYDDNYTDPLPLNPLSLINNVEVLLMLVI